MTRCVGPTDPTGSRCACSGWDIARSPRGTSLCGRVRGADRPSVSRSSSSFCRTEHRRCCHRLLCPGPRGAGPVSPSPVSGTPAPPDPESRRPARHFGLERTYVRAGSRPAGRVGGGRALTRRASTLVAHPPAPVVDRSGRAARGAAARLRRRAVRRRAAVRPRAPHGAVDGRAVPARRVRPRGRGHRRAGRCRSTTTSSPGWRSWRCSRVLYTDGMRVGWNDLRRAWRLPGRALVLGMPLTFALTAVLAHVVAGLPAGRVDARRCRARADRPGLRVGHRGSAGGPGRLRSLLNVESGLNDGLALPVVLVLLSVLADDDVDGDRAADRARHRHRSRRRHPAGRRRCCCAAASPPARRCTPRSAGCRSG